MQKPNRPVWIPAWSRLVVFLLVPFLLITACDDDDPEPEPDPMSILEIAQDTPEFSSLVAAIQKAGIGSLLNGTTNYTVFAPTNAAFEALFNANNGIGSLDDLTADMLVTILQYHVVAGSTLSGALQDNTNLPTLLAYDGTAQELAVDISGSSITINGVSVVNPFDVEASNGVIHAIDEVLLPPSPPMNLVELAASATGTLDSLVVALSRPEFATILAALSDEAGDFTVFAPTNQAFVDLLGVLGYNDVGDIPTYVLQEVLTYHVLPTAETSSELTAGNYVTLNGEEIEVTTGSGVTINGNVDVVTTSPGETFDIEATNGIVHIIDGVLLPDLITSSLGTVLQPALFDPEGRFTTLVDAVRAAGLVEVLVSDGLNGSTDGFTVFAPTNDAFEAAGIDQEYLNGLDQAGIDALTNVLLYHVVGLTADKATVASLDDNGDGQVTVPTALEMPFYATITGDGMVFINGDTEVILFDITADNGVVHAIDMVLMPPMNNVVEIAVAASQDTENPQFTSLVAALQRTANEGTDAQDLVAVLSGEGPFTIFAPTDEAFAAFLDGAELSSIPLETLISVLTYHVVPGIVFDKDLGNLSSNSVNTVQGSQITLNLDDPVTISDIAAGNEDAEIIQVNILGTNGVIHVIDQVLDPRE